MRQAPGPADPPAEAVYDNPAHNRCPSPCLYFLYAVNYVALIAGAALLMIGGADEGNVAGVEAENEVAHQRAMWGLYTWAGVAVFNVALLACPTGRRFLFEFWCSWSVNNCCSRGGRYNWRPTPAELQRREYENARRNAEPSPARIAERE